MKCQQQTHYSTDTEILAEVRISDDPEIMCISALAPEVQLQLVTARLHGYHPVSVRWPGGLFALTVCEPGTVWPSTKNVIAAYKQCIQTTAIFPKGTSNE
jgi:hypothetical protein